MSAEADKTGQNLTRKQIRAIECLLREPTINNAAKCAKVSRQTLYDWLKQNSFRAAYEQAKAEAFREGLDTLKTALAEGVSELRSALHDPTASIPNRIQASVKLIELGLRAHESMEVEQRLSEIEARMAEHKL